MKINFLQSFFKFNKIITLIIMVLINFTLGQLMTLIEQYSTQNYNDTNNKLVDIDGNFEIFYSTTHNHTYCLNDKQHKSQFPANFSDNRFFNHSGFNLVDLRKVIYLKIRNDSFECLEINSEKENILNGVINVTIQSDTKNIYNCTKISLDKINLLKEIFFLRSVIESNINNENNFSSEIDRAKVKGSYLISRLNFEKDFLINEVEENYKYDKTDIEIKKDLEISGPVANNFYFIFQSRNNTSVDFNAQDLTQFLSEYNLNYNKYPLEDKTNSAKDKFLNLIFINQAQYLKVFSKIVFVVMVIFLFN